MKCSPEYAQTVAAGLLVHAQHFPLHLRQECDVLDG